MKRGETGGRVKRKGASPRFTPVPQKPDRSPASCPEEKRQFGFVYSSAFIKQGILDRMNAARIEPR